MIRRIIHNRLYLKNESPTLKKILEILVEHMDFPYKRENLRLLLIKIGFKFTRRGGNSLTHKRQDLIAERVKFITRIRETREKEPHRKIVYTDETWINENHRLKKKWVDLESIQNPYRSLKDFCTVAETKKNVARERDCSSPTQLRLRDLSKVHCGYLRHQKHLREKNVKRGQSIRKKCPEDTEEDKKQWMMTAQF